MVGRRGCCAAHAAVSLHRLAIQIREVDIDADPDLRARYSDDVPVVLVNGVEAFRHRLRPEEFTAYVRGGARAPSSLAAETCVPCRGGVPPLQGEELVPLLRELGNGWNAVNEHHLEKEFKFPDFAQALAFTNRVGALAEEQGHHPDFCVHYSEAEVTREISDAAPFSALPVASSVAVSPSMVPPVILMFFGCSA